MKVYYQEPLKYRLICTNDVSYDIRHLHPHCEIIHMVEGSAVVSIDGTEYSLSENQAIIILPHQIHASKSNWLNKVYVSYVSMSFIPSFADIMKDNVFENPVITLDSEKSSLCVSMLEYIIDRFRAFPQDGLEYRKYINEEAAAATPFVKHFTESYMSLLLEKAVWKKKTASNIDTARRILEYCLENYSKSISVSKIAVDIGVTETTVTRVFSSVVKSPFRTYINNLRLEDVTSKLTETDISIAEIARKCGFDTLRTFNRVFVAAYGVTPTEYRNKRAKGEIAYERNY